MDNYVNRSPSCYESNNLHGIVFRSAKWDRVGNLPENQKASLRKEIWISLWWLIYLISNQLINSKFCVSLPHWSSSTVFHFPKVLSYRAWERGWQCWKKPSPQSGFSVRSNCKTRAFQNGNHFRLVFQFEKPSKRLSFWEKIIKLTLSLSTCLNGWEYVWKFNHRKLNFTDRVVYKMFIT